MSNFTQFRAVDQLTIIVAVIIVILAVATMVVVGSNSLKRWFGRRLYALSKKIEAFNEKYFSDDEAFDEEWMDKGAWERTRLK